MGRSAKTDGYLTPLEVSERLRVSRHTVYNWIKAGLLGADRAGPKKWLITPAALERFLARERVTPYITHAEMVAREREKMAAKASQAPAPARPSSRPSSSAGRAAGPAGPGGPAPQQRPAAQQPPAQTAPAVPAGFDLRQAGQFEPVEIYDDAEPGEQAPEQAGTGLKPAQLSKKKPRGGRRG